VHSLSIRGSSLATAVANADLLTGDGDGLSASTQTQAVVDDANADANAEGDTDDCDVPWEAWGPQATVVFEDTLEDKRMH
jgi:hypothetical protein